MRQGQNKLIISTIHMEGNVQQPDKDTESQSSPPPSSQYYDDTRSPGDIDTAPTPVSMCKALTAATLSPQPIPAQRSTKKSKHAKVKQPGGRDRYKRSHNRLTKLYQDWHVWKVSPTWSYVNLVLAFDATRDRWQQLYPDERLIRGYIFKGICIAYYASCNSADGTFSRAEFISVSLRTRLFNGRDQSLFTYGNMLQRLVENNFINPLAHRGSYALTTRSREFIKLFTAKYTELVADLIPPKK